MTTTNPHVKCDIDITRLGRRVEELTPLAALGQLAVNMFDADPTYWERHYPVALVNAVEAFKGATS
jgi:hypothetical protein